MKRFMIGILVMVVLMTFGFSNAFAGPSAKATAKVGDINIIDATDLGWKTIMKNTIKTANQKDLFIDVSLECGLYTHTLVKSKGGVKDTSSAEAKIKVRVKIDDELAYPGNVVFAERYQELSATLEGQIAECLTVDVDGNVTLDDECVTPEEIELILDTMNANSFNFILDDLSAGDHVIKVQAKITSDTDVDTGAANAWATIGKGSVTVEEVRLIKDEDIELP